MHDGYRGKDILGSNCRTERVYDLLELGQQRVKEAVGKGLGVWGEGP